MGSSHCNECMQCCKNMLRIVHTLLRFVCPFVGTEVSHRHLKPTNLHTAHGLWVALGRSMRFLICAIALTSSCSSSSSSPSLESEAPDGAVAADSAVNDTPDIVPSIEQRGCWTIETLQAESVGGVAMAIDQEDRVHLAYAKGYGAYYARELSNGYSETEIGNIDPAFPSEVDLAVDRQGNAHIHYYMGMNEETDRQLGHVYASNQGGAFSLAQMRDLFEKNIKGVGLAAGEAGQVHMLLSGFSYSTTDPSLFDSEVAYLDCSDGSCSDPRVLHSESSRDRIDNVEINLDESGQVAALWDTGFAQIMLQMGIGENQVPETIIAGGRAHASMGTRAGQSPVVAFAYNHGTLFNDQLQVATKEGGEWLVEDIDLDPVPYNIYQTQTEIGPAGQAHILIDTGSLVVVSKEQDGWSVDSLGEGGASSTMVIDNAGRVHVAWASTAGVKHAVCNE